MDSEGLCAIAGRRTFQCRLEILHRLCIPEQGYTSLAYAGVLLMDPGARVYVVSLRRCSR